MTKARQTILHGIINIIMAVVAAGVMDMDKRECSIDRILPVRNHPYRESNNYSLIKFGAPV